MDIHFKEEAKSRPSGKFEVQGGTLLRYLANADLLKVARERAYTVFLHGNNAAEAVLTPMDFMRMQVSLQELAEQFEERAVSNAVDDVFPPEFMLGEDVVQSNDALLAGNWSLKLSEKSKVRFSLSSARLQRERNFDLERRLLFDSKSWYGREQESQLSYLGSALFRWDYKPAEKWMLSFQLDARGRDYTLESLNAFQDTAYSGDVFWEQKIQRTSCFAKMVSKYQKREQLSYKFELSFKYESKRRYDVFAPEDSLFFLPLLPYQSGVSVYEQNRPLRRRRFGVSFKRNKKSDHWKWSVGLSANFLDEGLRAEVFLPQIEAITGRQTFWAGPDWVVRTQWPHWDVQIKGAGVYRFLDEDYQSGSGSFAFFSPALRFYASYLVRPNDKNNRINFSWRYSRNVLPYEKSNGYLFMEDTRSLMYAGIPVRESLQSVHQLGLFFMHMKLPNRIMFLSLNYAFSFPDLVERYEFYEQYWQLSYSPYRQPRKFFSMRFDYRDKLPGEISWHGVVSLSSNYFWTFSSSGIYERMRTFGAGFEMDLYRYFFDRRLKWYLSYGLDDVLAFSTILWRQRYMRHRVKSKVDVVLGDRWHFTFAMSYFFRNSGNALEENLSDIDFDADYELKPGWHFVLHGRRLNRLKSRDFFYVEQSETYFEYRAYKTYPGYVGLGIRKDF